MLSINLIQILLWLWQAAQSDWYWYQSPTAFGVVSLLWNCGIDASKTKAFNEAQAPTTEKNFRLYLFCSAVPCNEIVFLMITQ